MRHFAGRFLAVLLLLFSPFAIRHLVDAQTPSPTPTPTGGGSNLGGRPVTGVIASLDRAQSSFLMVLSPPAPEERARAAEPVREARVSWTTTTRFQLTGDDNRASTELRVPTEPADALQAARASVLPAGPDDLDVGLIVSVQGPATSDGRILASSIAIHSTLRAAARLISPTPSASPTPSPEPTLRPLPTPSPTRTPSPLPTLTPLPSATPSATPTPGILPSPSPFLPPQLTPTPTPPPQPGFTPFPAGTGR